MKSIQQDDTIEMLKRQLENHEVRVQYLEKMQSSSSSNIQGNEKDSQLIINSKREKRAVVPRILPVNSKRYSFYLKTMDIRFLEYIIIIVFAIK